MPDRLYRAIDVDVTPLGAGRDLVTTEDIGETSVVPSLLAAVLRGCAAGFATLDDHRQRLVRTLGLKHEQRLLGTVLRDLITSGLLVSQEEWLQSTGAPNGGRRGRSPARWLVTIPSVGRPAALSRTLQRLGEALGPDALRASLVCGGRKGSGLPGGASAGPAHPYVYELPELEAFVAYLARESGVRRDLIEYGVLPSAPPRVVDTGANRNLLQLLAVGHAVLSVDDDIDMRLLRIPAVRHGGRTLCHSPDVFSVRCFATLQQAIEAAVPADARKFAEAARSFLGAPPLQVLQDWALDNELDAASVCGHLFRAREAATGRVGFVFPGVCGDPGWEDPLALLWRDVERQANPASAEMLRSRAAIRAAEIPTLYHGDEFLSTCYAVDNSDLLPPFFPLCRGQDGMYGAVLALCFPDRFAVHLPECVIHDTGRPPYDEPITTYVGRVRVAEMLYACLLRGSDFPPHLDVSRRMTALGTWLNEIGTWKLPDFRQHVIKGVVKSRSGIVQQARDRLTAVRGKPASWVAAATEYVAAMEAVIADMPAHVDGAAQAMGATIADVQRWIGDYGKLLQSWGNIRASAARYHALEKLEELSCHDAMPPRSLS